MNKYLHVIANPDRIRIQNGSRIIESLSTSEPYVRSEMFLIDGVRIINDSHSTSLNSAWFALTDCSAPVIWVVGNMFNDRSAFFLRDAFMLEQYKKVKALIVLRGEDDLTKHIWHKIADKVPLIIHTDKEQLMSSIFSMLQKGDTILFSPAAPSFDLFENYMERGRWFHEQIMKRT